MAANSSDSDYRGVQKDPHHPSLSSDTNSSCVFDIYSQTGIESFSQTGIEILPEDWEENLLKMLIDLHQTYMPEEVRIKAIALVGEMIDYGFWY